MLLVLQTNRLKSSWEYTSTVSTPSANRQWWAH